MNIQTQHGREWEWRKRHNDTFHELYLSPKTLSGLLTVGDRNGQVMQSESKMQERLKFFFLI